MTTPDLYLLTPHMIACEMYRLLGEAPSKPVVVARDADGDCKLWHDGAIAEWRIATSDLRLSMDEFCEQIGRPWAAKWEAAHRLGSHEPEPVGDGGWLARVWRDPPEPEMGS